MAKTSTTRKPRGAAAPTIDVGERTYTIERPSGAKASRALALLRALSSAVPEVQERIAQFTREYRESNTIYMTPAEARARYPGEVIRDAMGDPLIAEDGRVRMTPSPIAGITAEDWAASNNRLPLRAEPSFQEQIVAAFDIGLETAEDHLYKLLALFTLSNAEIKAGRADGTLDDLIETRANELLDDGYADEIIELAVVCGETVDNHFRRKVRQLGDRLGNALRLIGLGPDRLPTQPTEDAQPQTTSSDGPSSSTPASSTDSPEPTDGDPTP